MKKKEKPIKNIDKLFNKCNLKNIQLIKEQLQIYVNNPEYINQYINTLKDIIQILFKYLIEGDKTNNNEIISTFVELKILNDIFYIEKLSEYKITSQIIQSLSFFLVNLKNDKSCLYYILSNFINNIITIEIENFDDEFYSYYINFLKSLSMRIDNDIILFLYNPELNSFPLVEYAFKFYNNTNPMISTVSLNIMVQIFHIRKNEIIKYFLKLPGINFFIFIINHCKDLIINLMNKFDDSYLYEDLIDYLFYINDLLDLNINEVNYVIINTFFNLIIFPVIIENIMNKNKIKETLMIIIMLFFNIKNETFNNIFLYVLFNDKFCDYSIKICIKNIKYYFFSWKEEKNNNNFDFLQFVDKNYSKEFLMSFLNDDSLIYSKSNLSEKCKFSENLKKIKNEIEILMKEKNLNEIDFNDVFNIVFKNIDKNEINEMNEYHNFLSFITGINVGFSYEKENKIYYENSFLFKFKEFILNENKKINNLIKKSFFNNFFCLENENFSINNMINILIYIIQNKINFSKIVLWENNLLMKIENNLKKKCFFKIFTNVFFDLNLYENNFILKENYFIFDNAFFNELKISSLLKNDYNLNENLIKKFFDLINNENYIFSINFEKCLLIIKNIFNLFVVNNNKNIKILLINEINSFYKNNFENIKKFNENFLIINLIFYSKNICLNDNNKIENDLNNINNLLININEKNKQIEQTFLIFLITLINILQEFLFYKNFEKNPFFILCLNRYYNINLIIKYFSNNFQIFMFENIFLMFDNIFFYFGEILDENIIKFNDIQSLNNIKIKIKEEKEKINLEICAKKFIINKINENNIKNFQTKINLNKEKYNENLIKKYQKTNIENFISDLIINI